MLPSASLPVVLGKMKKERLSPSRRENRRACSLPFHTSQRRESSQTVFLMALLVVEPSKRTPGNDSSTHIFSAWL